MVPQNLVERLPFVKVLYLKYKCEQNQTLSPANIIKFLSWNELTLLVAFEKGSARIDTFGHPYLGNLHSVYLPFCIEFKADCFITLCCKLCCTCKC